MKARIAIQIVNAILIALLILGTEYMLVSVLREVGLHSRESGVLLTLAIVFVPIGSKTLWEVGKFLVWDIRCALR